LSSVSEPRYFAFLRAINTGGRRLTNEQLLAPFRELGFTDVAAYQAAGNVTFRCTDPRSVDEERIEAALADAYGFAVPTFVRTSGDLRSIAAASPFTAEERARTAGKVQVSFLRTTATTDVADRVMALVPPEDRVVVDGRHWYWLPVAGVSASTLPVGRIEAELGVMTMRTLGTVERMLSRFAGP
jgi:uncharacterized protein (DUF1697 family)